MHNNNIIITIIILIEKARKDNPDDEEVLTDFQDDLASLLQHGISSVAVSAYAKMLIPEGVKDAAVNPKAHHDKLCINLILKQIQIKIKEDPKNLQKFIDRVMKPLGGPVEHLIGKLGELLHNTNLAVSICMLINGYDQFSKASSAAVMNFV